MLLALALPLAVDPGPLALFGTVGGSPLDLAFERTKTAREDFLLVNRGFRWINEQPFNR